MPEEPLSEEQYECFAQVIAQFENGATLDEIMPAFTPPPSPSTTSRCLSVLMQHQRIERIKDGRTVRYKIRVAPPPAPERTPESRPQVVETTPNAAPEQRAATSNAFPEDKVGDAVRYIVRAVLPRESAQNYLDIGCEAEHFSEELTQRFNERVFAELEQLTPENAARFRLKPELVVTWREQYDTALDQLGPGTPEEAKPVRADEMSAHTRLPKDSATNPKEHADEPLGVPPRRGAHGVRAHPSQQAPADTPPVQKAPSPHEADVDHWYSAFVAAAHWLWNSGTNLRGSAWWSQPRRVAGQVVTGKRLLIGVVWCGGLGLLTAHSGPALVLLAPVCGLASGLPWLAFRWYDRRELGPVTNPVAWRALKAGTVFGASIGAGVLTADRTLAGWLLQRRYMADNAAKAAAYAQTANAGTANPRDGTGGTVVNTGETQGTFPNRPGEPPPPSRGTAAKPAPEQPATPTGTQKQAGGPPAPPSMPTWTPPSVDDKSAAAELSRMLGRELTPTEKRMAEEADTKAAEYNRRLAELQAKVDAAAKVAAAPTAGGGKLPSGDATPSSRLPANQRDGNVAPPPEPAYAPADLKGRVLTLAGDKLVQFRCRPDGTLAREGGAWGAESLAYTRNSAATATFTAGPEESPISYRLTFTSPGSGTFIVGDRAARTTADAGQVFTLTPLTPPVIDEFSASTYVPKNGQCVMNFRLATGVRMVLIQALGPGLKERGQAQYLIDPKIRVMCNGIEVAVNDNWEPPAQPLPPEIVERMYPLAKNSRDCQVVLNAPTPGVYTIGVSGMGGGAGVAMLEVVPYY